jgi:Sigma-54 interaction domain
MALDGSLVPLGFQMAPSMDDWAVVRRSRANVLVTGPRTATDAFLTALTPSLRLPIVGLMCDAPLRFPGHGGTLILNDVDALAGHQQEALLEWINASVSTPRVISVTTTPLYPRVQADSFSTALYYRLNVICLEVLCA